MVGGSLWHTLAQADGVGRAVAGLLLLMSITSWVLIVWKIRLLGHAARDIRRAVAIFWSAADHADAQARVTALDPQRWTLPLVLAAAPPRATGTLADAAPFEARLTRSLRDALHDLTLRLQRGQVVLATVGATAPFVGLFGTVWGIYHALIGLDGDGPMRLERVSGPVGEALVMTAAGLAVAIPAVVAYNLMGRRIAALEAALEGFAHDLRALHPSPCPSAD